MNKALAVCVGLATLSLVGLLAIGTISVARGRHFEYRVLVLTAKNHDRTGDGAMTNIHLAPDESELSALGDEGWEVVASYLEVETAYPNFGKAEYVTGLQPNIRPFDVVLVLKRER